MQVFTKVFKYYEVSICYNTGYAWLTNDKSELLSKLH